MRALLALLSFCGLWSQAPASELRSFSFDEALDTILVRSTQVGAQKTATEAAEARAFESLGAFVPSLSVDGAQGYSSGSLQNLTPPAQRLGLAASLNLFRFGGDWQASRAARLSARAERSREEAVILATEEQAVAALLADIQARMLVQLQADRVKTRAESLEIAKHRYESGVLSQEETDRISLDFENSRAAWRDSEIAALGAQASLKSLLGSGEVRLEWPWKEKLPRELSKNSSYAEIDLKKLPEWSAAHDDLEAEDARVLQRATSFLPTLDATGSYGYNSIGSASGTGWTAQLSFSLPLLNQFQNVGELRIERASRSRAELQLEQVERDVKTRWEARLASFRIALQSALEREKAVGNSISLYESDFKGFQQGLRSANDLSLDEGRKFDSQLAAIQGWSTAHFAFVQLCHSVGQRVQACLESK